MNHGGLGNAPQEGFEYFASDAYRKKIGKSGNSGTIEGNVDKLVVRRLKGRGCSWTLNGSQAILAVCLHKQELKQNAFHPFEKEMQPKIRRKVRRRK